MQLIDVPSWILKPSPEELTNTQQPEGEEEIPPKK
jgi:hypothetical protein